MHNLALRLVRCLILASLVGLCGAQASAPVEISLVASVEEGHELAKASGRPLVVIFGAVWCPLCRRFKRETLADDSIQALGDDYHWVYVDIDRNVSMSRSMGVRATPHFHIYAPDGGLLGEALGLLTPVELNEFLVSSRLQINVSPDERQRVFLEDDEQAYLTWSPSGFRGQSICFSHVGYGPLVLPSQAPGQVLRLGLRPRTPSTLAKGQLEIGWTSSLANIFAFKEDDYRLDYLTVNSVLAISYGATDTVLLELAVSDLTRTNSILDPITTGWHSLFGLGDAGRDMFPEGDNVIDLDLIDGVEIEDSQAGSESRDITVTMQHNLTCGTEHLPAVSYAIEARHHTGGKADLRGNTPWSVGVSTSLARRFGDDFYTYVSLGYAWHGLTVARGLPLADEQWSALVAVEWRYAPDCSWVVQLLSSEGVAESRDPFNKSSNEINLGWKRELGKGTVIELGLIENIIEFDNSPDFGLHFGIRRRF